MGSARMSGWFRGKRWLLPIAALFFASSLLATRGWISFLTHGGARVAAALGESGLAERAVGLSGTEWSASLLDGATFSMTQDTRETPEREVVPVSSGIGYAVYEYGRKYYLNTDAYQVVCTAHDEAGFQEAERMLVSARDGTATSSSLVRGMLGASARATYDNVSYYAANHGIPFWTVFPVSWISSAAIASVAMCWVGLAASILLLLKRP